MCQHEFIHPCLCPYAVIFGIVFLPWDVKIALWLIGWRRITSRRILILHEAGPILGGSDTRTFRSKGGRDRNISLSLTSSATSGRELFSCSLLTNLVKVMTDVRRDNHYISKRGQRGGVKKRKGHKSLSPCVSSHCALFALNFCAVLRTQRTIYYYEWRVHTIR